MARPPTQPPNTVMRNTTFIFHNLRQQEEFLGYPIVALLAGISFRGFPSSAAKRRVFLVESHNYRNKKRPPAYARRPKFYHYNRKVMEKNLTTQEATKICTCCKQEKPLSEFNRRKASPDGLSYVCRTCQVKRVRESRNKAKNLPPPITIPDDIINGIGPEYLGKPIQRRTPLSAYTPRELMLELKRRRFVGYLEWIPPTPKPQRINLSDLE